MCGGNCGDRVLRRIVGKRIFPQIHERNSKNLRGDMNEEGKIPCHGNFEGTI